MGNIFDQMSVNQNYTSPVAPNQGQMPSAPGSNTFFGMDPSTFAIVSGQLGAALSPDGSPMQKVGQFASGYGQSQKVAAATAAKRKSDLEMLQYFMQGGTLTPAGTPGPTKMSITTDAQGNPQYTIVGNPNANNTSGSSPGTTPQQNFDAGVPAPTQQPSQVAPATANTPGSTNNFVKGLLPDFLPAALPDLTGVSPELIAQLSGQDNSASLVTTAANILQNREQASDVSARGWKQLSQEDIKIAQADTAGKRDDRKLDQEDRQLNQADTQIGLQAANLAETLRRNQELSGREARQLSQEDLRIKIAAGQYYVAKGQLDLELDKDSRIKTALEQIKDPTIKAFIAVNPAVTSTIVSGVMTKDKAESVDALKAKALNQYLNSMSGAHQAKTDPKAAAKVINNVVDELVKFRGTSQTPTSSNEVKSHFLSNGLDDLEADIAVGLLGQ